MINQIKLEALGSSIIFRYLSSVYEESYDDKLYDFSVFDLDLILDKTQIESNNYTEDIVLSTKTKILHSDMKGIIDYFENHIYNLKSNSSYESIVFLTYDLSYQFQAFCGDLECENYEDNYFTLRFMINIGKNYSIYVGFESEVKLTKIYDFIDQFKNTLTNVIR